MSKYRIIFSPTGGTEKVAKAITKKWDAVEDIDLSMSLQLYQQWQNIQFFINMRQEDQMKMIAIN